MKAEEKLSLIHIAAPRAPFCPYCKSRMSYLQAWGIHKDGEYRCPRCGKASNIRYTKRLRTFAAAASALGFLIAVLLVIFRQGIQFGHVLLIIVPFLDLYKRQE